MISGGTDAIHCKLFMGTFAGTTLHWFIGLPDGHITSFGQFSALFREQFIVNRAPPPVPFDLFGVKQHQGESLKDFLDQFGAFLVKLHTQDEALIVYAFGRGVMSGSFNDSLIRNQAKTFGEIRRRAISHVDAEEVVTVKRGSTSTGQTKPRERIRAQPVRVHEVATEKRSPTRRPPYAPRRGQSKSKAKGGLPFRPKFKMTYKELLTIPGMADKLRFPPKTDRNFGPSKDTWCEFHKAFRHDVENCIDQLRLYDDCLFGFAGDQVEVRGMWS